MGPGEGFQPNLDFEAAQHAADLGEALIVDLDGYEGPLHVLLALARSQKVDLLKLSVTKLADQYLAFVRKARARRFSLAADYLVMAAWLAYLKSRLLLPKPDQGAGEEPEAEVLAAQLTFRLAKLDAMRRAAETLLNGPVLKRELFPRGDPDEAHIVSATRIAGDLYELMDAYISQRKREIQRHYTPAAATAYPLEDARERLRGLLPELASWTPLTGVAPMAASAGGPSRASFLASTLSATLEFVREGDLEARQLEHFAEIYLRTRPAA
ncbi:MAG: segregation and condensation protein A [Caulobacterales bacterium]